MGTFVAFLRGINVGGKGVLPMQELIAILEALGARRVRTYIQSGNAVFEINGSDVSHLSAQLSAEIMNRRGFAPQVLVLSSDALADTIAGNPFPEALAEPSSLHIGFLASPPTNPNLDKLASLAVAGERFHLTGRAFYFYAREGLGRSKLAASAEKLIGVPMTLRNWRTVGEVMALAQM
jgi:uncharacterized protein (DUF1697 family)